MPFIIGALIAYILNPAVRKLDGFFENQCRMKGRKLRLTLSIAITYVVVLGMIIVVLFGIMPQIVASIMDLINYVPKFLEMTGDFMDNLESHFPTLDVEVLRTSINDAVPDMITAMKDFAANLVPTLYSLSMSIVSVVVNCFIVVIVSIYMLADQQPIKNSFKKIIFGFVPIKHIDTTVEIMKDCNKIFTNFFVGKAIDSLIIGLICFVVMTILQLPYAVLISAIVGVTNMIPYFGPFIGAIPGLAILLLVNPIKALIFLVLIIVLQQFDGLILGPKILGDSTGLKPLWIIIAITVGGSIAGVLGMLLGVPVVAVLRYLLSRYLEYRLSMRDLSEVKSYTK